LPQEAHVVFISPQQPPRSSVIQLSSANRAPLLHRLAGFLSATCTTDPEVSRVIIQNQKGIDPKKLQQQQLHISSLVRFPKEEQVLNDDYATAAAPPTPHTTQQEDVRTIRYMPDREQAGARRGLLQTQVHPATRRASGPGLTRLGDQPLLLRCRQQVPEQPLVRGLLLP